MLIFALIYVTDLTPAPTLAPTTSSEMPDPETLTTTQSPETPATTPAPGHYNHNYIFMIMLFKMTELGLKPYMASLACQAVVKPGSMATKSMFFFLGPGVQNDHGINLKRFTFYFF